MIDLYKQFMPEDVKKDLYNILFSGKLSYGKYGALFENNIIQYLNVNNLITTSTFNHALQIVLSVLNLENGDEIIISPINCLSVSQPLAQKGLKIIWADIDINTGTICVDDVEKKITKKTKAIFHSHCFGYVGYIDEINSIGRNHGITVIDDCNEAFSSEYKGKKLGNVGTDISVFSFQAVRLPNTIEGGAISFNDSKLFEKAELLRDYGIDRSKFRDRYGEINKKCDINTIGYGAMPNELSSYIGLQQINSLNNLINIQKTNAETWSLYLKNKKNINSLNVISDSNPNFWVYGLKSKNSNKLLIDFRKQGFYSSKIHINNNIYSIFKNKCNLKGVDEFINEFLAIPSGWWFNLEDILNKKNIIL